MAYAKNAGKLGVRKMATEPGLLFAVADNEEAKAGNTPCAKLPVDSSQQVDILLNGEPAAKTQNKCIIVGTAIAILR